MSSPAIRSWAKRSSSGSTRCSSAHRSIKSAKVSASSRRRIEANLERRGRDWGEVKSGAGSIRDIEFVTQFLQLAHGREEPHVRSINTLDGLVRLADFSFIQADEYRQLASAYTFFRTIEHSLQLMHHKQTHSLPEDRRELAFLARRLDFADADQFLDYYNRHRASVRAIYRNYLEGKTPADGAAQSVEPAAPPSAAHGGLLR